MQAQKIILTESLFIGKGLWKATYLHPTDASRVVKILLREPNDDWEQEKNYRAFRLRHHMPSELIPKYYGEVMTNLGKGLVFERIQDIDGTTSVHLKTFIQNQQMSTGGGTCSHREYSSRVS